MAGRWIGSAGLLFLLLAAGCGGTSDDATDQDRGDLDVGGSETLATSPVADSMAAGQQLPFPDSPTVPSPAGVNPSGGTPPSPSPGASGSATAPPPSNGAPAEAPAGTDATAILERAERAYAQLRSLEADFSQAVYVPLADRTYHSRGKMYHVSPDRFAMRFSDPEGDLIVADGSFVWMYHPSTDPRQVMRSRLAEGGQQVDLQREFLSNATDRYVATRTGSETAGGRAAHALTLVPRGPSPYRRIRIWVDVQDHLVRKFEITEVNDSERTLELTNLRPNASIASSVFEFTPPPGVQVYEP